MVTSTERMEQRRQATIEEQEVEILAAVMHGRQYLKRLWATLDATEQAVRITQKQRRGLTIISRHDPTQAA